MNSHIDAKEHASKPSAGERVERSGEMVVGHGWGRGKAARNITMKHRGKKYEHAPTAA